MFQFQLQQARTEGLAGDIDHVRVGRVPLTALSLGSNSSRFRAVQGLSPTERESLVAQGVAGVWSFRICGCSG